MRSLHLESIRMMTINTEVDLAFRLLKAENCERIYRLVKRKYNIILFFIILHLLRNGSHETPLFTSFAILNDFLTPLVISIKLECYYTEGN